MHLVLERSIGVSHAHASCLSFSITEVVFAGFGWLSFRYLRCHSFVEKKEEVIGHQNTHLTLCPLLGCNTTSASLSLQHQFNHRKEHPLAGNLCKSLLIKQVVVVSSLRKRFLHDCGSSERVSKNSLGSL